MVEFIDACIAPANIVITVLLALCLLYWLMAALGALRIRTLDIEIDEDEPTGQDVGSNSDAERSHPANRVVLLLRFLNFGSVPAVILVTTTVFVTWLIAVLLHTYTSQWLIVFQVLLLVPYLCAGAIATRFLTMPLRIAREKRQIEQRRDRSVEPAERDTNGE